LPDPDQAARRRSRAPGGGAGARYRGKEATGVRKLRKLLEFGSRKLRKVKTGKGKKIMIETGTWAVCDRCDKASDVVLSTSPIADILPDWHLGSVEDPGGMGEDLCPDCYESGLHQENDLQDARDGLEAVALLRGPKPVQA